MQIFLAATAPELCFDGRKTSGYGYHNQGCLMICLWLDGEGGSFYRQPASMPFLQQKFANFLKRSQIFLQDSAKYNEFWQSFAFCRNSGKILWKSRRKMTDLNENSAKFCKNHEKIAKINGAKDCKFEFRAVQRNANLVDLENPCKMRLFSLS